MSVWGARSADPPVALAAACVAVALALTAWAPAAGGGTALRPVSAAAPGIPGAGPAAGPASSPPADAWDSSGASGGAGTAGGALEGLPIRSIRVAAYDVFDTIPPGRLGGFYRVANALHVRTRERTVTSLLLFAPGDPWRVERARETERALRRLDFLQPRRIAASRTGDSVDVVVETRDAWTTRPEFNLERTGGQQFGAIGFSERNLLGLGKRLDVSYEEDPTGIARRLSWSDPSVLGTRTRFRWVASSGSSGSADVLDLSLPFFREDAPVAFGMAWRRGTSAGRLFQSGSEVASLDRRLSETEAWYGRGMRRGASVWRLVGTFTALDRTLGPSRLAPGAPAAFDGPEEEASWRRFGLEALWWRPRFLMRRGIEELGRDEDYDVGPALSVYAGFAPDALGSTADEGYLRVRADAGAETRFGFGFVRTRLETRLRRDVRELLRRADARWIVTAPRGHALVLAARAAGSTRPARDVQQVVGGLDGLRAYPVHALAGRDLVRLNAEQRWLMADGLGGVLMLGAVGFVDAARAWGPGAEGTGWFTASGVGLRIAPPRGAVGPAFRLDVAWPVSPTRDGRRAAVFSLGSSQAF